jgi:nucleoside-diphosphate-sugar epimerase
VILRLTGIYGPDRVLTRVAALRDGLPLAGSPDAWLNLIHVDDAAAAVVAAARQPQPEPLYLVTDDRPCTRGEYYTELSRLVNAPPPTFDPAQVPRHGQGLNKRCRNQRIKRSLGLQWQCPTFVEGLRASL